MSWQLLTFAVLALVVVAGFAWYERSHPPARLIALVAALAALAIAGRLVLTPVPNVVATTDIALLTGYALGGAPGFAVGALAAPVSNIWLGQGPWTAWQTAGWGLVGLAGAGLALISGRRLGRLGLAVACGLAGLAYGALQDFSVMITYGGEQSVDRYVALSSRGIPFNIAHAVGNFAIAYVAGPALVRMISRYRTRLTFTWHRPPAAAHTLVVMIALCAALLAWLPMGAGAASPKGYLESAQNKDGGFAATKGQPSSPAMTGWAMLGLEAAGRNPLDVEKGGKSPVDYLRKHVKRVKTATDIERTILALVGAGEDPRDFGGRNLVDDLRKQRASDGSIKGQVNMTAFYVLAMDAAGASGKDLKKSVKWLRDAQNEDGGWGFRLQAPSDPDSTGAALQALGAANATGKGTEAGVRWLRKAQAKNGGFGLATSGVVNSQSTAWAVQGMTAVGAGGKPLNKALAYLRARRNSDGSYSYSSSSKQTPVWVTAQVLMAVNREPLPLSAVPREPKPDPKPNPKPNNTPAPAPSVPSPSPSPAPSPSPSVPSDIQDQLDALGKNGGKRDRKNTGPKPTFENEGRPVTEDEAPVEEAPLPPMPPEEPERKPSGPYVVAGLGGLGALLGAGFLWYRRRLP